MAVLSLRPTSIVYFLPRAKDAFAIHNNQKHIFHLELPKFGFPLHLAIFSIIMIQHFLVHLHCTDYVVMIAQGIEIINKISRFTDR